MLLINIAPSSSQLPRRLLCFLPCSITQPSLSCGLGASEWLGELVGRKYYSDLNFSCHVSPSILQGGRRGGSGGRSGGRGGGRGAVRVGVGEQRWGDPAWRAERLHQKAAEINMPMETETSWKFIEYFQLTISMGINSSTSADTATVLAKTVEIGRQAPMLEIETGLNELNIELKQKQEKMRESDSVKAMLSFREKLLAFKMKAEIFKAVAAEQVQIFLPLSFISS
ncbi:DExH-box ATP-dependent RNA helicase DExH1-like [Primulina eburnea]|uniref:DExH-box ATP-dependent RNA helicase DExH1-like n=1 Tax=Primulina eburnea TaxID=1245227 RepID=UPI003C6CA358